MIKTYAASFRFYHTPTPEDIIAIQPRIVDSIKKTEEGLKTSAMNITFQQSGFDYVWKAEFDIMEDSWLAGKPVSNL